MKKTQYQRINSQEELDSLLEKSLQTDTPLACFVALNFGLRSSKDISFTENNDYFVFHHIDDSEEYIPHKELMHNFIGEAITKGALYKY